MDPLPLTLLSIAFRSRCAGGQVRRYSAGTVLTCSAGLVLKSLHDETGAAVRIQVSMGGGGAFLWTLSGLAISGVRARPRDHRLGGPAQSRSALRRSSLSVSICAGARAGRLRELRATRRTRHFASTCTGGRAGRSSARHWNRTVAGNPARTETNRRQPRARPRK